jgi:hypothetical protein
MHSNVLCSPSGPGETSIVNMRAWHRGQRGGLMGGNSSGAGFPMTRSSKRERYTFIPIDCRSVELRDQTMLLPQGNYTFLAVVTTVQK